MLSGCCWKRDHINYKPLDVPPHLFEVKESPRFTGTTNRDLVNWTTELTLFGETCQADKITIKNILDKTK